MLAVGGTSCISLISVAAADENSLTPPRRLLPTENASLGFGGSPAVGGDKTPVLYFLHFCVGGVSLPSGRFVCVGTTPRGVYFRRKNGFLRVGALRRRTRCSLLHTALFRRSCMGVVSLPSACVSCCRNAGRPRVTAAYSPFLCRCGIRPVRAESPLGGHTRPPAPNRAHSGSHAETRRVLRVDGDDVFGSEIIDTIGPFQADQTVAVALAEGHRNAVSP